MDRARCWLLTVMLCSLLIPCVATGQTGPRPTLRLRNGGYISGQLLASDDAESIVWQGDGFTRPLQFALSSVHSLQYPQPAERGPVIGPYVFELSGGDRLIGQLISLDESEAVLEIPPIGKVSIKRSALQRYYRQGAADVIYSGPAGPEGWTLVGADLSWIVEGGDPPWRHEGGHLTSNVAGAVIGRQDRPPAAVCYEITLAWKDEPRFEFLAGLSNHAAGRTAFRLETWDSKLVVTRESDKQADVAVVQQIASGAGSVALTVMFDETQGRLLVYTSAGEQVADFTVPPDKNPPKPVVKRQIVVGGRPVAVPQSEPPSGLLITNRHGTLTLQHLTIRRWSGIVPKPASAKEATLELTAGETQTGEIRAFDSKTRQMVILKDGKEQRFDEAQLQDVRFSQRDETHQSSVSIQLKNGMRLCGDLKEIQQDALVLQSPAITPTITLPVNELQALVLLGAAATSDSAEAQPRLELPGASLRGILLDARQAENSSLVFQPAESSAASPLAADVSGKLVYRELPPPQPAKPQSNISVLKGEIRAARGGVLAFGLGSIMPSNTKPAGLRPKPPGDCLLHLRSGDTLPCKVESIDERGVTFKSDNTEAVFAPHERIKALELRLDARPVQIQKSRFERLLTLPRIQRDNPPEHLIRSLEGDYLRGRIIAMSDKVLEIEMRLEGKKIDRDQITRILWLHPDEQSKALVAKPADTTDQKLPPGIRVQAVPRTGNRLTFFAQEYKDKTLFGHSEILGACHVQIDQIDQLLLGATIEEAAATLAFHQWKLRAAAEPLPDPDPNAEPGSGEGMESVLVGKSAPEIELDLLTGGKFRLSEYKDKVVVLDFWASWCGPCLQAMPQVDKVAKEFAEQGVTLIAINLEETPDKIKNALTRLKLETAVALDTDGRIAERYGATSIPQTVIVGRDGKVVRLFVGGGTRFEERLRQALKAVLEN